MDATTPATLTAADETTNSTATNYPEITLYWLNQSRSQSILWLLEELKLTYKLEIFHRDPNTKLAPPELTKIHALGKSPIISIKASESAEPLILAESAVIIEYLVEHFGKETSLSPKQWKDGQKDKLCGETEEWMRYRYFLHYSEGSLMPPMLVGLIAGRIKTSPAPFFVRPITNRISSSIYDLFVNPNTKTHFEFLEQQLRSSPDGGSYLCGTYLTGADILLSFPLIASKKRSPFLSGAKYPLLEKYIDKLEVEPGYKKAADKIVEVEGSFSAAF